MFKNLELLNLLQNEFHNFPDSAILINIKDYT